MTKKLVDKKTRLSLEFDEYIINHPELSREIPKGALVVITQKSDKKLSQENIADAKKYKSESPVVRAEKHRKSWTLSPLSL